MVLCIQLQGLHLITAKLQSSGGRPCELINMFRCYVHFQTPCTELTPRVQYCMLYSPSFRAGSLLHTRVGVSCCCCCCLDYTYMPATRLTPVCSYLRWAACCCTVGVGVLYEPAETASALSKPCSCAAGQQIITVTRVHADAILRPNSAISTIPTMVRCVLVWSWEHTAILHCHACCTSALALLRSSARTAFDGACLLHACRICTSLI